MMISPKTAFVLVSFSLGELGDGLNIFQGIYLNCIGWNEGSIGVALSLMGFTALLVQTGAGDAIDKTGFDRRTLLSLASVLTALSAMAIMLVRDGNSDHALMYSTKVVEGVASCFIAPCLAACTLATFGPNEFDRVMSSNIFWGHVGSVVSALIAGVVGYVYYPNVKYCFLVIGFAALVAVIFVWFLPSGDPLMGRGFRGKMNQVDTNGNTKSEADGSVVENQKPANYWDVFTERAISVFCATCFLFHFANANVLLVLGELMGGDNEDGSVKRTAIPLVGGAIFLAQSTMALMTVIGDTMTQRGTGRKTLLMIGILSLPLRCVLILYWQESGDWFLLSTQILDGVGAGFLALVTPYLVADITFGTGRFNVVMGLVGSVSGIGATLSNLIGQTLVEYYGHSVSLVCSLILSIVTCFTFGLYMPETYGERGFIGDKLTGQNEHYVSIDKV